jgi:GH35 family endo-1,4-beta-xylanase
MGTMTFLLPDGLSADTVRELERASIVGGPDNMPWPGRVQIEPGRLLVHRDVEESGALVVPWEIEGAGRLMVSTATLMERPLPYGFRLELARGKVNQLRCQTADWQASGLQVPDPLAEQIRNASLSFGRAVAEADSGTGNPQAQAALVQTAKTAEQITELYIDQLFEVRHQREPRLNTALGCRISPPVDDSNADAVRQTCNSVCLPLPWSAIESSEGQYRWQPFDTALQWAESQGLTVTGGPVLDFSAAMLPAWLWLYERDVGSLQKFMAGYVSAALRRYRRRIRRWLLTHASNSASLLGLGEDELLWLSIRMAQVAKQIDPELELVVGVSQPWGECMATEDRSHSPYIFADTLVRSDLSLAALDLELVMGVTPRGSYCRDLLEASRLLDLYSLLGVPLWITLGFPSSTSPDPKADPELRAAAGHWHEACSPAIQAEWAAAFTSLALCKPYVQAVHWTHLSDASPHQFPHCGLVDALGKPKPALQALRLLREKHLR